MNDSQPKELTEADIRERVAKIWKEELGAGAEQPEATFFELSGQSITAIRVITRIDEELGVRMDVGDLFEDPDLPDFTDTVLERTGGR